MKVPVLRYLIYSHESFSGSLLLCAPAASGYVQAVIFWSENKLTDEVLLKTATAAIDISRVVVYKNNPA